MIRLDAIRRQYGARVLFDDVRWMIPPRARCGLVGPNGSGKTTLLRILAGLDLPDSGALHRPRDLSVGYLPQEVDTIEGDSVLGAVLAGFPQAQAIEQELRAIEEQLAGLSAGEPQLEVLTHRYGELRDRFEALGGHGLESQAKRILSGLGIAVSYFERPVTTLSGGWRMRLVLARLLLGAPGLLLLDEPTNHLDLEAIDWLEGFLETYEGAYLIVSHDRYFLNRMVQEIVELDRGQLTTYPGDYETYWSTKQQNEARRLSEMKQQERELAKVQRFIDRFRYKNTKARQVQSRIKAMEKIERIEAPRARAGIHFAFPAAPRSGDRVITFEQARKHFGAKRVYDALDLILLRGDRVALIGPNGAGKSTLLKLIAGVLELDGGDFKLGHNVIVHYYAQHQLEALDPDASVLEELERSAQPEDRPRLRSLVGRFLFHGDDVTKRVSVLSGGEKARLALCKMLLAPANLLLLDEPTNHLDLQSREVLEDALNEYQGTFLIVSHDRYFINRVATKVALAQDGQIEVFDGDYDEFSEWRANHPSSQVAAQDLESSQHSDAGQANPSRSEAHRRASRREEAEARNAAYRKQQAARAKLDPVETEIQELEQRLAELEAQQGDPDIYSNPERAAAVGQEKGQVATRLEQLYASWEALMGEHDTGSDD